MAGEKAVLSSLKATTLTRLAAACGLRASRTKAAFLSELPGELRATSMHSQPQRVLSIDMGVRNLAYCLLVVDPSRLPQRTLSSVLDTIVAPDERDRRERFDFCSAIAVEAWNRIDLTQSAILPGDTFGPPLLAPIAYDLIVNTFLASQPDSILIERQRHRTGGHAAVQEWTFRVNMLESMLWMTLETLRRQPGASGFPQTHAIIPQRVNQSMLAPDRETAKVKASKVQLAGELLQPNLLACSSEQAEGTRHLFLGQGSRGRGAAAAGTGLEPRKATAKLDDLADSLLQGVAWVQWELNKRALRADIDFEA